MNGFQSSLQGLLCIYNVYAIVKHLFYFFDLKVKFEDTKGQIRIRMANNELQNTTQKTIVKDRTTRTPLKKTGVNLGAPEV